MVLDLRKFFRATNPFPILTVSQPENWQYYIDFSAVRGSNLIQKLGRTIIFSEDEPTCQLVTGHIGCGKSTELSRLKNELELKGFHIVHFKSFQSFQGLDRPYIDISDILLVIARQVSQSLEAVQIKLQPTRFQHILQGAANLLSSDILEVINQELIEPAQQQLKQQGKAGLVTIIDDLDRFGTQYKYLFIDQGEQLKKLKCHLVYTVPLVLMFSNDKENLTNRFGSDPQLLPMVRVQERDGSLCQEGIALLRQMVLARAFPDVELEERLSLISEVFDTPETLDRLCQVSGGYLRNLLVLLNSCFTKDDLPWSRDLVERLISKRRNLLSMTFTRQEWKLLAQVVQQKTVSGEEEYQTLLRSLFVFEYRDAEEGWFDINPVLAEAKELQS